MQAARFSYTYTETASIVTSVKRVHGIWARELERSLGGPLHAITTDDVRRWVSEGISEGVQLDFKRERYKADSDDRFELAKDAAAFANRLGGLIVLGVADTDGVASKALPISSLADSDIRHIHKVLAAWTEPVVDVEVALVADGAADGFLLVAVPPSARRPHAVHPPGRTAFHWPFRRGSSTDWLSEPEIYDAYRSRSLQAEAQQERLIRLMAEGMRALAKSNPWLVVGLVPAGGARLAPVESALVADYETWTRSLPRSLRGSSFFGWQARAGPGRVVIEYGGGRDEGSAERSYLELHTDGAGFAAVEVREARRSAQTVSLVDPIPEEVRVVPDETLVDAAPPLSLLSHDMLGSMAEPGQKPRSRR